MSNKNTMQSKIMVEYDFDKNEPFLQIEGDEWASSLADKTLKNFIERANELGISLQYSEGIAQIRIGAPTV